MTYWITGDTHFYHNKMCEYESRPEYFNDKIILNWCMQDIDDGDIVIHLGDVILYRHKDLKKILDSCPGQKVLIKGNHDSKGKEWYLNNGFLAVFNSWSIKCDNQDILLTHRPVKRKDYEYQYNMNIHGHLHSKVDYLFPPHQLRNEEYSSIPWNRLFCLEYENYKPIPLRTFIHKTSTISYYQDMYSCINKDKVEQ